MCNVNLSEEELADRDLLLREAVRYATRFREEEDSLKYQIGISNFVTDRARPEKLVLHFLYPYGSGQVGFTCSYQAIKSISWTKGWSQERTAFCLSTVTQE